MNSRGLIEVELGLERCLRQPPEVLKRGAKFGLLMNQASVTAKWDYACDVLSKQFSGQLTALFSPQHGLWCEQQANMIESEDSLHPTLRVPVYSLYSQTREPTDAMLQGIDLLLVDLQDVGTRVYTFIWTAVNCLRVCAKHSVPVVVLDRPNPIGGTRAEGPPLETSFRSFVGLADIPMRHAMTIESLHFTATRLSISGQMFKSSRWQGGGVICIWNRPPRRGVHLHPTCRVWQLPCSTLDKYCWRVRICPKVAVQRRRLKWLERRSSTDINSPSS